MRAALLLIFLLGLAPAWADLDGKALYTTHCSECHGDKGKGDGSEATYYDPKPSDLSLPAYKHGTDDASVLKVVKDGLPGTQMEGSPKLSPAECQAIVDYLKTLRAH